jgi:hypothetical protein
MKTGVPTTDFSYSGVSMHYKNRDSLAAIQRQIQTQEFLSIVSNCEIERSIDACKTRTVLSKQQVIDIFKVRLTNDSSEPVHRIGARLLAEQYLVNEKTVRDIWCGRTWHRETLHLDPNRKLDPSRFKAPGRPRGSGNACCKVHSTTLQPTRTSPKKSTRQQQQTRPRKQATEAAVQTGPGDNALGGSAGLMVQSSERTLGGDVESAAARSGCAERLMLPGVMHQASIEEADPLPTSSSAEDPFHDDWPYWSGGSVAQGPELGDWRASTRSILGVTAPFIHESEPIGWL